MGAVVSRPDLVEIYVKLGLKYDLPMLFLRKIEGPVVEAYPSLRSAGKNCWRPSTRGGFRFSTTWPNFTAAKRMSSA